MKHVKLFEQFLNESKVTKIELEELKKLGFDTTLRSGVIRVKGENPWNDGEKYTFCWDGQTAWSEHKDNSATYEKDVTTALEFRDAFYDRNNWD